MMHTHKFPYPAAAERGGVLHLLQPALTDLPYI
jgi:hypothetical protein